MRGDERIECRPRRGWLGRLVLAALLLPLPSVAFAHGGLSMEKDMCKLRIGIYSMHFTGYQPMATGTQEFCEDIPKVGDTVVVLDAVDAQLREVPIEVRVIRDTGDEQDLEAITVLHLQPKLYPSGTVAFEHTFNEAGKFVGLVSANGPEGVQLSRFPFSVGKSWGGLQTYVLALAVILAGSLLYWYSGTLSRRKSARSLQKMG